MTHFHRSMAQRTLLVGLVAQDEVTLRWRRVGLALSCTKVSV
jgi:hypothetical protein